jgi:2',3'-cyclic-nucleotide 2'-phosphodiesterase (5'-nucleotidase family)
MNMLKEANYEYLAANIYKKSTMDYNYLQNTKPMKIFNVGEIKLGVIGLATVETLYTSDGDLGDLGFADYKDIIIRYSKQLREEGANAVILLAHVGTA